MGVERAGGRGGGRRGRAQGRRRRGTGGGPAAFAWHLLPRAAAGGAALRRGRRSRRAGDGGRDHRDDEADEPGPCRRERDDRGDPGRQCRAGRGRRGADDDQTPSDFQSGGNVRRLGNRDQPMMIRRLFIANRGEIALRVIRTAARLGMTTILAVSDADRDSLPALLADEVRPVSSYLSIGALIAAAEAAEADAIHPGYGFLSENAAFAIAAAAAGIV